MKLPHILAATIVLALLLTVSFAKTANAAAPDVSLTTPTNNSTNFLNMTNFTYKVTGTNRVTGCSLYVNSTLMQIMGNIQNASTNEFDNVTLATNGIYSWYVSCQDNTSTTGTVGPNVFNVNVDKTAPTIRLDTQNSSINASNNIATFMYTPIDYQSGLRSCMLLVNDEKKANATNPSNSSTNSISIPLSPGTYVWSVNCTDNNDNSGVSGAGLIETSAASSPQITVVEPANSTVSNDGLINFRYTPTSIENITICFLRINNTINTSKLNPLNGVVNNFTDIELHDGFWTWAINCTSITGKNSETPTYYLNVSYFQLLSKFLVVKAESPPDKYFDTTGAPSFTYTPASVDNIVSCTLITNNSIRERSTSVKGSTINSFNSIDMGDGIWNWRVECKNRHGSVVSTPLRTITISRAIAIGEPIAANITIPGLETPLDLGQVNATISAQKKETNKAVLLLIITAGAGLASAFVFVIMHPKYKKLILRELGVSGKVMAVEQLKFYIDKNLRRGVSEERIRRQLKKYNWEEKDIDDSFQAVYSEMAEELKTKKTKETSSQ